MSVFEFTTNDVFDWVHRIWMNCGNFVNGQPDALTPAEWKKHEFESHYIPDVVSGINVYPVKTLVRIICAAYEPGPNYGPKPCLDLLHHVAAEARGVYLKTRINRTRKELAMKEHGDGVNMAHLKKVFDCEDNETVGKWLKKANIKGPRRGEKNWKLKVEDFVYLMEFIFDDSSSSPRLKERVSGEAKRLTGTPL